MKIELKLIFCVFLSIVQASLYVHGPKQLAELFKDEDGKSNGAIQSQMANFGHIPYGQVLVGRLYFNEKNPHGCEKGLPFTDDFTGDPDGDLSPIFLVERGNCSFVTMARNVEKAGGALAIIIDTKSENVTDVILSDDGTGAGIEIPSMLINRKQGEMLKNYLFSASDQDRKSTTLKAWFEPNRNKDNSVKMEYWYTSSSDKSLDFIRDMAEYLEPIIEQVDFQPMFVTWACPACDAEFQKKNCMGNGKYCASQHNIKSKLTGVQVLQEDIRQYCIYTVAKENKWKGFQRKNGPWAVLARNSYTPAYFEYITQVHELCRNRITEHCSKQALKALGLDYKFVQECVDNTVVNNGNDNSLLKAMSENWTNYGHNLIPSININKKTFRGRLTPDNVFEGICAAFQSEPHECRVWQEELGIEVPKGQATGINQKVLFYLIIGLVIVNVIIILCYRKYLQRELDQDMKMGVQSAVSQYVALSQVPELKNISQVPTQGNAEEKKEEGKELDNSD